METIIYEIGAFVLTSILYAIPILTACSFIYEWNGFIELVLIVISFVEFCGLGILIDDKASSRK